MTQAKLIIPTLSRDNTDLATAKSVKAYVSNLSLGDTQGTAQSLLDLISKTNRQTIPHSSRLKILNLLEPLHKEVIKSLVNKYKDSVFPLSTKNQQRRHLVNELYSEMAFGFKHLIQEYYDAENHYYTLNKELISLVRITFSYLSKRLVSAYATYSNEPQGIWQDLNQLYLLLCRSQAQQPRKAEKLAPQIHTATHEYLRICMLSITNPYHLMQGEAHLIFQYLNKWTEGCSIHPFEPDRLSPGDLIIDLDHDVPPQFIFSDRAIKPKNCRTIEMQTLLDRFQSAIRELTEGSGRSLNERLRRDMLTRLQTVWNDRMARKSERTVCNRHIRLVSSLSAVHYYVDKKRDFLPEVCEVDIHIPKNKNEESSGLSLLPETSQPWAIEEKQHLAKLAAEEKHLSPFEQKVDVWQSAYGGSQQLLSLRDQEIKRFNDHSWMQLNESKEGMGVRYLQSNDILVRVGNLICYQNEEHQAWSLGKVTWIREEGDHFNMGIRFISGRPEAVAVRAISGTGSGSEYVRALIIHGEESQLCLPASLYDYDTCLLINFRTRIHYIKLSELKYSTTCFAVYSFKEVDMPLSERHRIEKLKSA